MYTLPPIQKLPTLPGHDRNVVLEHLFEPSPPLRENCVPMLQETSFPAYDGMIAYVKTHLFEALLQSPEPDATATLDDILRSHPRLGEKETEGTQSQAEQAHLQSQDGQETERLKQMNLRYEETFPGLRYVTFVNGRPRSEILGDMQARIDRRDISRERGDAIQAMCDIAFDRARNLSPLTT